MRTKHLLKAKKFFIETFGSGKFPTKKEMMNKMIPSSFVPDNHKVIFSLFYTKEIIENFHGELISKFNITTPQLEIIKILYFSKNSTITQDQIGQYTFSSKSNISSHLTNLENKKFIVRKEDKNNKRRKVVNLTKKGEEKLFEVVENFNPEEIPNILTKQETIEFLRMLEKIRVNINKPFK